RGPAQATRRRRCPCSALSGRVRAAHRAEEVARRIDHHDVVATREAGLVGLQAAVELREARVAAEGLGEGGRRGRIALTLDALRIAVGLGDDHLALALRVGTDRFAFGETGGAQLVGDALAL